MKNILYHDEMACNLQVGDFVATQGILLNKKYLKDPYNCYELQFDGFCITVSFFTKFQVAALIPENTF